MKNNQCIFKLENMKDFAINLCIVIIIIATIFDIFMPEKYQYNYEGRVVRYETIYTGTASFNVDYQHNKYIYIDKETKDSMCLEQDTYYTMIFDYSYTYKNNNQRAYTYRWYTHPLLVMACAAGLICWLLSYKDN